MDFCGKLPETISDKKIKGKCGNLRDTAIFLGFLEKKFLDIVKGRLCTKFQVSNGCVTGV